MINWLQLQLMELLLNLAWLMLAFAALGAFASRRRSCAWTAAIPHVKALLAIGCMLVLLFPVVSASDDLHPTQAVLEDASKRIHQLNLPAQQMQSHGPAGILPALLTICLLFSLPVLQWLRPDVATARVTVRERVPRPGRAPPYL
jgi:hypothetical protein